MPESSRPAKVPLPGNLRHQLESVRQRVWRTRGLEWVCLLALLCMAAFFVVWISDRLWDTPKWWRIFSLLDIGVALAIVGGWIAIRFIYPLRHWEGVGRFLRRWDRRTGDRALSAIGLTHHEGQALESTRLRKAAIEQLADQLTETDLEPAVDQSLLRKSSSAAALLILLAGVLLLLAPLAGLNALQRAFFPWLNTERYTFVQLADVPETQLIAHGETDTFTLSLKPDSPWKRDEAQAELRDSRQHLTTTREGNDYHFVIPGLVAEESLAIRVGDARREVRFIPTHRPGLEELTATVTLPAYLQYPSQEIEITGGHFQSVIGSELRLTGSVTRALKQAEVRGAVVEELGVRDNQFALKKALTLTERPQLIEIHWEDTLGFAAKAPLRLELRSTEDQPPRVELLTQSAAALAMLGNDTTPLGFRADDDFGVRELGFVWGGVEDKPDTLWEKQSQRIAEGAPEAVTLDGNLTFSPQSLGLTPGTWQVWAYARDARPNAPPSFSSAKPLRILTEEEHANIVRAQFQRVQERLESVAREESNLRQANQAMANAESLQADALEKQRLAEEANAEQLGELAGQAAGLLEQALKNSSLDTAALKPWGAMLSAMQSVAETGMPKAAKSLAQAQSAAGSGNAAEGQAALSEAIAQQEANLEQLAEAMGQGQAIEEKLEAATFVNRMREVATAEELVANTMKGTVLKSAGLAPNQLGKEDFNHLNTLAGSHESTREEVTYLITDLNHYHRRTEKPVYGKVHGEMVAADTPTELAQITQRVRGNQHGRVIQRSLRWAKQFHAWADALAAGRESEEEPPPNDGTGESEAQADTEMMLALMRLVQREMTLRDQTRALDRQKAESGYAVAVKKLADEQRSMGFTVAQLLARVMGPEIQQKLRAAGQAMNDAATLLDKPDTGGETIAAETEVIELLGKAAQSAGQMGGNSKAVEALAELLAMMELGNSPGGNANGAASDLASIEAQGEMGRDGREDRTVRKTSGFAGGELPEEFREALGRYFERREALRE